MNSFIAGGVVCLLVTLNFDCVRVEGEATWQQVSNSGSRDEEFEGPIARGDLPSDARPAVSSVRASSMTNFAGKLARSRARARAGRIIKTSWWCTLAKWLCLLVIDLLFTKVDAPFIVENLVLRMIFVRVF